MADVVIDQRAWTPGVDALLAPLAAAGSPLDNLVLDLLRDLNPLMHPDLTLSIASVARLGIASESGTPANYPGPSVPRTENWKRLLRELAFQGGLADPVPGHPVPVMLRLRMTIEGTAPPADQPQNLVIVETPHGRAQLNGLAGTLDRLMSRAITAEMAEEAGMIARAQAAAVPPAVAQGMPNFGPDHPGDATGRADATETRRRNIELHATAFAKLEASSCCNVSLQMSAFD